MVTVRVTGVYFKFSQVGGDLPTGQAGTRP